MEALGERNVGLERGADLDPRSAMAPYSVGETMALLRRYDEAEIWLRRAIDIRPDFGLPYVYMSMMRIRSRGDTADASLWLRRMVERGATNDEDDFNEIDLALLSVRPDADDVEIFAQWDQYAEMPRANGVFYRIGWSYFPSECAGIPGAFTWWPPCS